MFDWARGSALPHFIKAGFPAGWNDIASPWLKDWSVPWFNGALEFRSGLRVLDVGSSTPSFAQSLHDKFGCVAHALDVPAGSGSAPHFGLRPVSDPRYPNVAIHIGLAGQDVLPADHFDIVHCNSVIEHTYDTREALDSVAPLTHMEVLRDLVRMIRPGGILLMNWDTYLDGVTHHIGWEYESDLWLLSHCGMRLADPRRPIRSARYIYQHPDTLFFSPKAIFQFRLPTHAHGVSINTIWRKPGGEMPTRLLPRKELEAAYFPPEETDPSRCYTEEALSSEEIEARFKRHIEQARRALGGRLVHG